MDRYPSCGLVFLHSLGAEFPCQFPTPWCSYRQWTGPVGSASGTIRHSPGFTFSGVPV